MDLNVLLIRMNIKLCLQKWMNNEAIIKVLLIATFQGVIRLFVLAFDTTDNDDTGITSNRKYFLARANIENYDVSIDRQNSYDQSINNSIKNMKKLQKLPQDKQIIIQHDVY